MELAAPTGARRLERTIPIGDLLPREPFEIGVRVVAPPADVPLSGLVFYCLAGGMSSRRYFDLGDTGDRRFSFAEAMATRGAVVIAADHPGLGASTTPKDEWALTIELLASAHTRASRAAIDELREGTLMPGLEAIPAPTPIGCGHSMGAVTIIQQQAKEPIFAGLALLGYRTGGVPSALPPEHVAAAKDPRWLHENLPRLADEMPDGRGRDSRSRHRATIPGRTRSTRWSPEERMTESEVEEHRQRNYDLYERMRKAQNARDTEGFIACFAEDVVFEAPAYSSEPIAVGREAMAGMFEVLKQKFDTMNYQIKRFIPAVDPDLVVVEVKGDNKVAGSDTYYRNDYLFLVGCRDGRITSIFEYSNPQVYADAVD